ncbi:MAG: NAD(P)H-dependent oxidoreductase [Rhodocyclaceae bacterium]
MAIRILVIPASVRQGSLNLRLARNAIRIAREAGIEAIEMDLRSLALPVYDGDLEAAEGIPAGALTLLQAVREADGILIVTPEYNGFPTPLLINAFDWLSRIEASDAHPAGLAITANKPAALLSASPGAGGALRSMNFVRQYLQMAFAMIVVPQQFALGKAHEAFDADGALIDARAAKSVSGVVAALAKLAEALRPRA